MARFLLTNAKGTFLEKLNRCMWIEQCEVSEWLRVNIFKAIRLPWSKFELLNVRRQVWFDRRTNYTRSLAVMSMVGYILGLGDRLVKFYHFLNYSAPIDMVRQAYLIYDSIALISCFLCRLILFDAPLIFNRHPSNLMLDRMSGKILHIDFGDCFEVTLNQFPVEFFIELDRFAWLLKPFPKQ